MIVEAEVWVWTPRGMRLSSDTTDGYLTVRDAERLLEEADVRRMNCERERLGPKVLSDEVTG
jgi:hypothetical protein